MQDKEEMKKFGIIYMLENQVNGKQYIGQTINVSKRMAEHRRAERLVVEKAIEKYGYENFQLTILEDEIPVSKLAMRERQYIADYNTFRGRGYNREEGGGGTPSEATRQKMSENHADFTGGNNPRAKITPQKGKEIKREYEENEKTTMKDLADKFALNPNTVSKIVRAKHWTTQDEEAENMTPTERMARSLKKLTDSEREKIRERYKTEEDTSHRDLAEVYDIDQSTVSRIINKKDRVAT